MTTNRIAIRFLAGTLALAVITHGARWLTFRRVDNLVYKAHVLDRNGNVLAGFERGERRGKKVAVENCPNKVTYRDGALAESVLGYYCPDIPFNNSSGLIGAHEEELYSGKDVRTTIDLGWQRLADSLLWANAKETDGFDQACLVVMDVKDGGLPVVVNLSRKSDVGYGLGNRAMELDYEPGPVMEPLVWTVAMKDGMFRPDSPMAETIPSGKIAKTYKAMPEHFTRSLKECLLQEGCIREDIHDASDVRINGPESTDWSESEVDELAHGWAMKMTATHIAAFYSTLATGVRTIPYLVKKSRHGEPEIFGEERNLILEMFDEYGTSGLVGRSSVSRWCGYAAETFAGIFPKEEPRFAIVCAVFSARQPERFQMTRVTEKVATKFSEEATSPRFRGISVMKRESKMPDRETTIDSCWQKKADSLLRNSLRGDRRIKGACIAVMNVWSGNVPVMVNLSRNEKTNEYHNFAACLGYEPGPVMEPLTWTVALDDGLCHSDTDLKESIASGNIPEAYKNIPGHYVAALRSFLPEDDWNTIEVDGVKYVEIPDPKSTGWTGSTICDLSEGYSMKVSPLHVMTLYGALASGNIVGAHIELAGGRDVPSSRFGKIDRKVIISALDCDRGGNLVGKASLSRFNEYGRPPKAGESFAGFFPKDEPEYAVVCATLTDQPYSGYKMTGAAQKVAEELSGLISAGMERETFPDYWRKYERTNHPEDESTAKPNDTPPESWLRRFLIRLMKHF
ncbi:MAG TPA: hypothetical protein DDX40_01455 [Rikenellaceae bacterium]|nr:hypothetical protein [Rikenellaceae bacterium]